MKRIGIIAALPGELKPLVKGWKREPTANGAACWSRVNLDSTWIAACAGMGAEAATRAFSAAEQDGPLNRVMSVGWAGALREGYGSDVAHAVSEVIDVRTAERFSASASLSGLKLVTTPTVASAKEKRRLAKSYGASLVDMEAATVARLARARGIPFDCFKTVTDAVDARLPDFNPFLTRAGHMRMAAFAGHCLLRPWFWPPLVQMGKDGMRGAEALSIAVLRFLEERKHAEDGN